MSTTTTNADSTTTTTTDNLINEISHKTPFLDINDSDNIHNNFKQNYMRKSQNIIHTNRHYQQQQIPYTSYPYHSFLQQNPTVPLMSQPHQPFIYPPNFTNIYSRNNANYINTKRTYNLNKLWPHSLKKQTNNKETPEPDSKKDMNTIDSNTTSNTKSSIESTTIKTIITESSDENIKSDEKLQLDNKSPMCLINELVRLNKIKHEYELLDERGPAHKKVFYIMLKLGMNTENEEKYEAQGSSIKKTQHAAAELALKQTKFKLPVKRDKNKANSEFITDTHNSINSINKEADLVRLKKKAKTNPPTVKLNTLAMKLGLVANYTHTVTNYTNSLDYNLDLSQPQHKLFLNPGYEYPTYTSFINNEYSDNRAVYARSQLHRSHQSYQIAQQIQRPKQIINVKLTFANKEFKGQGLTLQSAKNEAASKALEYFTEPDNFLEAKILSTSSQNPTIKAYRPPQFYQQKTQEEVEKKEVADRETKSLNKSEIQLVCEYSTFFKKSIDFELIQESGPSHIKKFVTKCIFGKSDLDKPNDQIKTAIETATFPLEALGEGHSKKESKKNAAIKMLALLKEKFEPLLAISSNTKAAKSKTGDEINKQQQHIDINKSNSNGTQNESAGKKHRKPKGKNIDKIKKTSPEYGKGSINPISRLIQILQAKKEKEPVFELLPQTKKRNQEFVMQVTIELTNGNTSSEKVLKSDGKGSTKKLAKQKAAEAMLIKLGYQTRPPGQSVLKPSLKVLSPQTSEDNSDGNAKESESSDTTKEGDKTNEKKVKFVEDSNLKSEEQSTAGKLRPKVISVEEAAKKQKAAKNQMILTQNLQRQQKFKQVQQAIASNNQSKFANGEMDLKHLDLVYKIAFELLESVTNIKNSTSNTDKEFYSETAEQILKSKKITSNDQQEQPLMQKDLEDKKLFIKILTGGDDVVNYKKILEYIGDTLSFKINYQSLLGRDGSVYSYVSLSILPETDKPLNGNGNTHIESSNAAALCALQYLASKHNCLTKQKAINSAKISPKSSTNENNTNDMSQK